MPFGAELQADGAVRFRLWAPAARRVELRLGARGAVSFPMAAVGDGWFEEITDAATAGTRYCYRIDDGICVPDPASRFQPDDVHGPSEVIDPLAFDWGADQWPDLPWEGAVLYELHVGTFSPGGDFRGVEARLDHLVDLGVTAIQLMPVADFPGARNWGYDGALPYAPDSRYGRPEALKRLVKAAHARGLLVLLDVVYNHFGPEGNYLHLYAPPFFDPARHTPWGAALNFAGEGSRWVRSYFIHNALYWLEEYRLDGLRLDAVHAVWDDSDPDILEELAAAVHNGPGSRRRRVHLVLENDNNAARYLRQGYRAQWNDDLHHALHVLLTGEVDGYYQDYADAPLRHLGRCLAEGFAYQGEPSGYRHGARRGAPSGDLPPSAFVAFLQNHDQVGNRAFGERLTELTAPAALRAATALLLLSPQPPLLFMGQEWGCRRRFPYFCDFGPDLAKAVTEGRRGEFARFAAFSDPAARARIPDPAAAGTFDAARLDLSEPWHGTAREWLEFHRQLLSLRQREIAPLVSRIVSGSGRWRELGTQGLEVRWRLIDGAELALLANLSDTPLDAAPGGGRRLYATHNAGGALPPWYVAWHLGPAGDP